MNNLDFDLERANKYWNRKEELIYRVARQTGKYDEFIDKFFESNYNFEEFMFNIFDYGEYEATEEEILEAVLEVIND